MDKDVGSDPPKERIRFETRIFHKVTESQVGPDLKKPVAFSNAVTIKDDNRQRERERETSWLTSVTVFVANCVLLG